ncbi:hypothetical protein D043_1635A, partial [Vibrio parahaemolyticus EKP-021]
MSRRTEILKNLAPCAVFS